MEIARVGDETWIDTIVHLIEEGADVNATRPNGTTALMHAVHNGRRPVVSILIEQGADINAQNASGTTALMMAAKLNRVGVVQILIEEGADRDIQDGQGRTAADLAATEQVRQMIVEGNIAVPEAVSLPLPPVAPIEVVSEGEVPKADTVFEVAMVSETPMAQFLEEGGDDAVVFHYEQQIIGMPRSAMVSAYNDKSAIHYECTSEKGLMVNTSDVVDTPYYSLSTTFQAFIPVTDMLKILGSKHNHWKLTKGQTLPFTASRAAVSADGIRTVDGEPLNLVSRDHCQAGTDKTVFSATPVTMSTA
jgi:hypothetical protein